MDHTFHTHKDLMLEAKSYLGMMAGDTSLEAIFSRLEGLFAQTGGTQTLKARMEPIRSLADTLGRHHTPDQKVLDRFFRPFSIGQGSMAQMLVMSFYEPTISDWTGQLENIRGKFSKFASGPAPSLAQLNIGLLFDDSASDSKEESRPLEEQLEETGLTDAEKWQILRAVRDTGPYLDQLTAALMPVRELIEENLPLITPLLEDFVKRWDDYFAKTSFETFLSDNMGIEAGDLNSFRLHIYPSIFDCGTISLSILDTNDIYMQIGICLKEGINVKALPMESHQLLEGLKALSDKSKLSILGQIRDKRSYGQELARETGLSTATISHHMSALINCGFIRLERVENRIYYQMDKENLRGFLKKLFLYLVGGDGLDT